MTDHVFCGFGFGPIQAGLFVHEAGRGGRFGRIVVAEIDAELVEGIRANGGRFSVNVARADGLDVIQPGPIEIYNPRIPDEREKLIGALREATEIVTALPSIGAYRSDDPGCAASLIGQGLAASEAAATLVYTTENHNQAAEVLENEVNKNLSGPTGHRVRYLNTVIGKMSRVVTDEIELADGKLAQLAPGIGRAYIVESFNRILVSRCDWKNFKKGLDVFEEKDDLSPFEEAKLYGHNAIHALLGYVGMLKGYRQMVELRADRQIMATAKHAFLEESGGALVKKYTQLGEELFTEKGWQDYAEDLLERMTNAYLADTIERTGRDVLRKLGRNDRLFGTMGLVLEQGIEPKKLSVGALAAIAVLGMRADEYGLPKNYRFSH